MNQAQAFSLQSWRESLGRSFGQAFSASQQSAAGLLADLGLVAHLVRHSSFSASTSETQQDDALSYSHRLEAFSWVGAYDCHTGQGTTTRTDLMERWRTDPGSIFAVPAGAETLARTFPYGPAELKWLISDRDNPKLAAEDAERANVLAGSALIELALLRVTEWSEAPERLLSLVAQRTGTSHCWRIEKHAELRLCALADTLLGRVAIALESNSSHTSRLALIVCNPKAKLTARDIFGTVTSHYVVNHTKLVRDGGAYRVHVSDESRCACLAANLVLANAAVRHLLDTQPQP